MKFIKNFVIQVLHKMGYTISKVATTRPRPEISSSPYSPIGIQYGKIVDVGSLMAIGSAIPGMITPESGGYLYSLCYFQSEAGDVVEVGSWQGRSTSFLARAVINSRNGKFYAIDHFKGNVGKEEYYIIKKRDLSDLKDGFWENIRQIGLASGVRLLDMTNEEAAKKLKHTNIRFLFIDADHTKNGVKRDITLFFPKLVNGALVVFDDYSKSFPGLIEAIDELLQKNKHTRVMTYRRLLILKYSDQE